MRVISLFFAALVLAGLYLLVFERDVLFDLAGTDAEPMEETVAEETPIEEDRSVSVVAMKSQAKSIDGAVIVRGRTEAVRQVELRAETSGQIVSTPLRKGTFVDEGQLVCELDPGTREIALSDAKARLDQAKASLPEAQARVSEAEARLEEATINDTAASTLSQEGFASETRVAQTRAAVESARAGVQSANAGLEAARAGVLSAEAGVAAAENELEKLEIRAPFGGLLETDSAELGALLQPGSLCATIIQLDPIHIVGFIPETLVDRVELGATSGARLASGREVLGRVTFISRSADPQTRTFRVDVEVPNPDLLIRDGQTAEIGIASEGQVAHLLPQSALTLDDEGALGVRLVEDSKAAFAPVDVLRDTVDGIWVAGLQPEVEIIVVGQEFVTDGVPVDVTYREVSQ